MKKYILVLLAFVLSLASCADTSSTDTPASGQDLAQPPAKSVAETSSEDIDWGETEHDVVIPPEEEVIVEPTDTSVFGSELGSVGGCTVHTPDFHTIRYVFVEYVGMEAFNEWKENHNKIQMPSYAENGEDYCPYMFNFPDFIKDFSITEEIYYQLHEDTMSYYAYDHPAALIFHGTEEEIEAWYRDFEGSRIRMAKKEYIQELKRALASRAEREIENLRTAAFEELYRAAALTEDELSDILRGIHSTKYSFPVHIDKDLIFTATSEFDIFAEGPPEIDPDAPLMDIDWGEPEEVILIEPIG